MNPKSEIRNPKSPGRRGASILEVLFAILVTTIGLLGAVAVFPVASSQARKGRIADAAATAGRSAINTIETRGMRRYQIQAGKPGGWMAWNSTNNVYQAMPALTDMDGFSFCLDPRFVAWNDSSVAVAGAAALFPYDASSSATGCPRMGRLTLWNGQVNAAGNVVVDASNNPYKMDDLQADSIFVFDDDLTINRFSSTSLNEPILYDRSENSRPAAQAFYRLDHDSDNTTPSLPLKRNNDGQLSWMATLVPKHELYLGQPVTAILGGPGVVNNEYVLSIVVFNQRPAIDLSIDTVGSDMYRAGERVLRVDFDEVGGVGFAGGEVLLTWTPPVAPSGPTPEELAEATKMLKVRSGNWIMLAKYLTHADDTTQRPIFRWYRVTDSEAEVEWHAAEGHYAWAVSLSGQDWEVTPGVEDYAIVMDGVVGVYEKTVRLEAF